VHTIKGRLLQRTTIAPVTARTVTPGLSQHSIRRQCMHTPTLKLHNPHRVRSIKSYAEGSRQWTVFRLPVTALRSRQPTRHNFDVRGPESVTTTCQQSHTQNQQQMEATHDKAPV
jgi:hypothetical protein